MADVEAVTLQNEDGLRLFGALHTPRSPRRGAPAVVLLTPGVKMRVGPGRLYLPLAELLTSLGHTVLRLDFSGLGDSEGDIDETELVEVYSRVDQGQYLSDALTALSWMRRERGHERLIIGGLCGGAITALYAAEQDPSVEAILSIGMPVTLSSDVEQPAAYLTNATLERRRRGYLRRVLKPQSWWRLLTLQSELGVIRRSLFPGLGRRGPAPESASEPPAEFLANLNRRFPPAFFSFLDRGGRALMLFSENDHFYADYEEKFVAFNAERLDEHADRVTKHVIPGANHIVSLREWREEMLTATEEWIATLPAEG